MEDRNILIQGAKELGLELTDIQVNQFFRYKDLLIEWNKRMNLTAITEQREIIIKHFLDCISSSKFFDFTKNMKLIDVGTGAGFPGIPLKIAYPNLEVTLLDSLNKRLIFLEEVIKDLGLQEISTVHSRAEEGGQNKNYREKYDLCVSRAVAHMSVLLEYCVPFIKEKGFFIAQKGPTIMAELEEAKKALQEFHMDVLDIKEVNLPFSDISHYVVIMQKKKLTSKKYPRKAGTPTKLPLK